MSFLGLRDELPRPNTILLTLLAADILVPAKLFSKLLQRKNLICGQVVRKFINP